MNSLIKAICIIVILLLTQACAYMAVSERINGREETYKLRALEAAYKSENGNLAICLSGKTEDRVGQFWVNVPIERIANHDETLWSKDRISSSMARWHMPEERLNYRDCHKPPVNHTRINTVTLESPNYLPSTDELLELLSFQATHSTEEAPSVYLIFDRGRNEEQLRYYELAYTDKNMLFKREGILFQSNHHGTLIDFEPYCIECSNIWYAALPFAIAIDIILAPFTLIAISMGSYN